MLRFGGERALTKQAIDEGLPKYHMPLEEANKIIENNIRMLDEDALALCSSQVCVKRQVKPRVKIAPVKAGVSTVKTRLGRIMHRLHDLEPAGEPEKPLNVDLGRELYQMEDW